MDDRSTNGKEQDGLSFEFRKKPVPESLQQENWEAVEAAISRQEVSQQEGQEEIVPVRRLPWVQILTVAASIMLVAFGIWYIQTRTGKPQFSEIKTGFGEVKNILLPDSSTVILNANSSMRIPQQWSDDDSKGGREVWLEGEAFFEVQKKASTQAKFVVHTDQVDVEVLGTRFNVNTRRQHSIVSLEEGKVQLSVHGEVESVMEKKTPMVLRPGQVVDITTSSTVRVSNEKDITALSGWSRNEFHFDNTSLAEVARLIEDTYGYKMQVKDTTLFQKQISGDLRAANVQELVKVLEFTLKLSMRIEDKTIYVTNP